MEQWQSGKTYLYNRECVLLKCIAKLCLFYHIPLSSGFNVERQCWEPVLDNVETLIDVRKTECWIDIGIQPRMPVQVCFNHHWKI